VAVYAQDDAEFFGFEAAISFDVIRSNRFNSMLRLFADHVDADLANGQDLPRLPPMRLGANFDIGEQTWNAGVDVVFHGERDDISSFQTDSFTMVDANFLYRLNIADSDVNLFARATNLLDEDARRSASFLAANSPLPGRSFHFGVRAKF